MGNQELVRQYWDDIHRRNWDGLAQYFHEGAVIRWHNTNEQFTADEFIRINAQYPGNWLIKVERLACAENLVISVVKVCQDGQSVSFHATSFFEFRDGKIAALDEYWGDDGEAPEWRLDQHIGRPIRQNNP